MENLGYREGSTKLSKHRRMSRAASIAVESDGIPLSMAARLVEASIYPNQYENNEK